MSLLDGFVLSSLAQSKEQQATETEAANKLYHPAGVLATSKMTVPYIAQSVNKINFHLHLEGYTDRQGSFALNTPPTNFHYLWRYSGCPNVEGCWGIEVQGGLKTGAIFIKTSIGLRPTGDYVQISFDNPVRAVAAVMYTTPNLDAEFCDEDNNCYSANVGGTYMLFDDLLKYSNGKKLSQINIRINGITNQVRKWIGIMIWPYGDEAYKPKEYPVEVKPVKFLDFLKQTEKTAQFKVQWYNARGGFSFGYSQYVASLINEIEENGLVVWSGVQSGWQGGAVLIANEESLTIGGWANYPATNPTGIAAQVQMPSASFWAYPQMKCPNMGHHAYINNMVTQQAWDYWGATGDILLVNPSFSTSAFSPLLYESIYAFGVPLFIAGPIYRTSYRGTMFMGILKPVEVSFEEISSD